ncbi:hypothetical protein PV08_01050 [Exophiala spinifera]|uniref:Major facilitator superfamily (MFS) profile domain-containing protein n=1 Tax=Exophiala spinifera TaxID=91928 RepID=A0A0D2BPM3_9EURO|nr:uncharacterized protein PV08_01050 [Exophiala spinifera]KIW20475.1 hypothetical protein PV08_01050 [Exophiala spinifera]
MGPSTSEKQSNTHLESIEQDGAATIVQIEANPGGEAAMDVDKNVKVASDGHTVLVPQPSEDPHDPLNWPSWRKHAILLSTGFFAFSMDFPVGAGISCVFLQSSEFGMTPVAINRANNYSVLLVGFGGFLLMPLVTSWGRVPLSFWSIVAGTFFTLGCALAQTWETYLAMKCLQAFALSTGLIAGLAFITDMFCLHERARKIGIWTAMWMLAPYLAPMLANFIVTRTGNWRNVFWLIFAMNALCILLVLAFFDETWYQRDVPMEEQPTRGPRLFRVVGIWQLTHKKYFPNLWAGYRRLLAVFLCPVVLLVSVSTGITVMWVIGINQSSALLLSTPRTQGGYGFSKDALSYMYFAPIIGILVGGVVGRFVIDLASNRYVRRHNGVYAPEARIPPVYFATFFMVPGLVLLGQALAHRLSWVAIAAGWILYVVGGIMSTVATTAYLVDSYATASAEISIILNFARLIGGFTISYCQVDWGTKVGYNNSFGTQAGIVVFSTLIMAGLHIYGRKLRSVDGLINW